MKNLTGIILVGYFLLNAFSAKAQSYAESALIFSRTVPGGSARIQGLGGTQVSLGGDYSSAFSNPAGLGMFNRSEFSFSPGYSLSNVSSSYLGNTVGANQSKFIVPGFSIVIHSPKDNGTLLSGNFGITYTRTNDFNRTMEYDNSNVNGTIINYFMNDATGFDPTQFDGPNSTNNQTAGYNYNYPTGLAYYNYLFNPVDGNPNQYYTDVNWAKTHQHEVVQTKGNQGQLNLAYGINLGDHVYLGGALGFASINYTSHKSYAETSPQDSLLSSIALTEDLTTKASGINATFGAIFKPVDLFQFGLSIATPTGFFSVTDNYSASMTSNWNIFPYGAANLPEKPVTHDIVTNTYQLNTPWRFSGGATFFIQKHGFISADAEYINYAGSKYKESSNYYTTSSNSFDPDNAEIKSLYRSVLNLRLGGEYRYKSYRFRAGYSIMPDPYKSVQNNVDNTIQSFSTGVGYRATKFYVDLAGVFANGNTSYSPYVGSPVVSSQNKATQFIITFGFPF